MLSYGRLKISISGGPSNYRCLTLYNTFGRQGAKSEAEKLSMALKDVSFQVHMREWKSSSSLMTLISLYLDEFPCDSECEMLFVCIMAHGVGGSLKGRSGSEVSLNYVLQEFHSRLSNDVSLVSNAVRM